MRGLGLDGLGLEDLTVATGEVGRSERDRRGDGGDAVDDGYLD
jgi:hypothetical protein